MDEILSSHQVIEPLSDDVRISINEEWLVDYSFRALGNQKCSQCLRKFIVSPIHHNSLLILSIPYHWDTALRARDKYNVLFIRGGAVR